MLLYCRTRARRQRRDSDGLLLLRLSILRVQQRGRGVLFSVGCHHELLQECATRTCGQRMPRSRPSSVMLSAAVAVAATTVATATKETRPHILMILADDCEAQHQPAHAACYR